MQGPQTIVEFVCPRLVLRVIWDFDTQVGSLVLKNYGKVSALSAGTCQLKIWRSVPRNQMKFRKLKMEISFLFPAERGVGMNLNRWGQVIFSFVFLSNFY